MISTQLRSPYSNFQRIPTSGVAHQILQTEILAENLVTKPWPRGFDPRSVSIPPYRVSHWLRDGEQVNLGGKDLEVIHTPGESPDHICLLDRADPLLFCGDILLHGPVWTLDGGSLEALIMSYRKLMKYFVQLDHLKPQRALAEEEPFVRNS